MPGRWVIILVSVIAAACVPIEKAGTSEQMSPETGLISSSGKINTESDIFTVALPVAVVVSEDGYSGGKCDLESGAIERHVLKELKGRGVENSREALLFLRIRVRLLAGPEIRDRTGATNYCHTIIETVLEAIGLLKVAWALDDEFVGGVVLYEHFSLYFNTPGKVLEDVKSEMDIRLSEIGPTILGKAGKGCGYFQADPERACRIWFEFLLSSYQRDIRCMRNEAEVEAVREIYSRIDAEFMEWMEGSVKPHEEPGELPADDDHCKWLRGKLLDKEDRAEDKNAADAE